MTSRWSQEDKKEENDRERTSPHKPAEEDVKMWREFDIHEEEQNAFDMNAFDLFGREEPLDTVDFTFPEQLPDVVIQLQCQEDYTQSTGMAIWLGADLLADFMLQSPHLVRGKKVLEVGAGVGLCGIVAYHLQASQLVSTDGDLDALDNLRRNVQHNTDTKKCTCRQMIWGKNIPEFRDSHGRFDVILGSDLFYMTRSIKPLFQTVDQLLTPGGIFLAASPCAKQNSFEDILKLVEEEGFVWTQEASDVYIFRRKAKKEDGEK
ncbi:lysine methyltransferase METTL21A [Seminavis robusta]|uniref:Lysine methyltransferase METTL21A n=1 Tax=Seminavis robusta TaxID=568900 RepID=A0A9N8DMV9_9STRA|nr:lysine methyltransferase METTL21A [Seminavis robusta]|eukprot:Sro232_g093970.1 lysine methyltransferase METTL21A (263) ;mRNA; f:62622-63410